MQLKQMFVQVANATDGRIRAYAVRDDFISFLAGSLASMSDPTKPRVGEMESVCSMYKDSEIAVFTDAAIELSYTAQTNLENNVIEDLFIDSGRSVAHSTMDQMMEMVDVSKIPDPESFDSFINVEDPDCGSGQYSLAWASLLAGRGFDVSSQMAVHAVACDRIAAKMAYINLSLYGIPAVVVYGDLETETERDRWYTPVYLSEGWIKRYPMEFGGKLCDRDKFMLARQKNMGRMLFFPSGACASGQPRNRGQEKERSQHSERMCFPELFGSKSVGKANHSPAIKPL